MNRRYFSFLAFLAITGCAGTSAQFGTIGSTSGEPESGIAAAQATATNGVDAAAATITPEDVYQRIALLASDEMAGRDTPSPELDRAADYIAGEFERLGLQPAGDDGSYIQRYALQKRALIADDVRVAATGPGGNVSLVFGSDFFVLPGAAERVRGDAVYAGRAGNAETDEALRGNIAAYELPGTPQNPGFNQAIARASQAAEESGAVAKIFVLDAAFPAPLIRQTAEHFSLSTGLQVGETKGLPAYFVSADAGARLAAAAGVDPAQLQQRARAGATPIPATTVELAAPMRIEDDHRVPNVVAVLPGSDPELRDTYVIFSAHFDHVGIGRPDASGDSIYNGADDNASGTSALLEVAEAFAALEEAPARSLVFLAVSGEEKGLLGSQYYSDNPTLPIEQMVANINVDMIGRNAPDSIVVIGQEYSSLGPLVREVAAERPELGLTVAEDIWPEQRFFFRSDHYNFARKEIPALFFFAGVHEDYHRPSDHVEKIDTDKTARVARLIFYTAYEIASREDEPQWTEEGLREIRAMTRGGRR